MQKEGRKERSKERRNYIRQEGRKKIWKNGRKREAGKKEGRQEEINEEGEGCKIRKNRRGEQASLSQLKAVWRLLVYGHKKQHPNPFRNRRLTFGGYKLPLGMATGPLRELRPATERYRLPFRRPTPCEAFSNSVRVS